MEMITPALLSKGPWALCLGILIGAGVILFKAFKDGHLVPASQVDRIVKAYETQLDDARNDRDAWRAAHALKVEETRVHMDQTGQLLEHARLSAHAWESIRAVAERAGDAA